MPQFTHLHVHTEYSILDGMSKISDLVDKCLRTGMNAMAITDHGNMFGIKEFFDYVDKKNGGVKDEIKAIEKEMAGLTSEEDLAACRERLSAAKAKIFKPIFGCEAYVARQTKSNPTGSRLVKEFKENFSGYHLILLAKNETGYHNLCKMVSYAWIEGKYQRPRIDHELLEKYHEGIIVSSACLAGEVPKALANMDYEKAKEIVTWYKSIFGDDYYLEIQRHETNKPGGDRTVYEQQKLVNEGILRLAAETGTKVIATNDVHFVEEEHAEAHDRLICLSTGKRLNDADRLHYTKQEWLKTPEEMAEIFADVPEALANTQEIVDKVETYKLRKTCAPNSSRMRRAKAELRNSAVWNGFTVSSWSPTTFASSPWRARTTATAKTWILRFRSASISSWVSCATWVSRDTFSLCRTSSPPPATWACR